ncbi:MAG: MATE family efflux transporter [Gammaproteobacteria bacterium]|nr:MATE family efflux transporter [Gammaproteobacteria bacterium]
MILSNLSIALLGIVDTAVVGHLSEPYYLGAVTIGTVVFSFLYWGLTFLRMGTTGITAQAHGEGNAEGVRTALGQALMLSAVLAVVVLIIQRPIIDIANWLLNGSTPVEAYARDYYRVRIWSTPAVLANLVILGWFLGMQNARGPLLIILCINLVNIVLDFVFVIGLHLDVRGVAFASLLGKYVGLGLGLLLVSRELQYYPGLWRWNRLKDGITLKRMLSINHNIFNRTLLLIFVFAFFAAQGARQGDVILAANAILLNFQALMALVLDGFAHAVGALVGRAIGSRQYDAFARAIKITAIWAGSGAILFTIVFALFGRWLVFAMTDIQEVRITALNYLPWVIFSPIISVWCYVLDGIFIGATRAVEMRNTMLLSVFLVYLPAWYLLQPLGNHGLWLAFLLFMATRGISMGAVFVRSGGSRGFVPAV